MIIIIIVINFILYDYIVMHSKVKLVPGPLQLLRGIR